MDLVHQIVTDIKHMLYNNHKDIPKLWESLYAYLIDKGAIINKIIKNKAETVKTF